METFTEMVNPIFIENFIKKRDSLHGDVLTRLISVKALRLKISQCALIVEGQDKM